MATDSTDALSALLKRGKDEQIVNRFNRGEVDQRATARQDVDRVKDSGTLIENFMPIRLGPMQYRPGWECCDQAFDESYIIPFVARTDDTALVEIGVNLMQVWVDDALITRAGVATAVVNGGFDTDIVGWTDDSDAGGVAVWATGGYASLVGTGTAEAALYQTIVSAGVVEHSLRIVVQEAPVLVKIGYSPDATEIYTGTLLPGTHSLAFTPVANFTVRVSNVQRYRALVDSIEIEGAGVMQLTVLTPATLSSLRFTQSVDVLFIAGDGIFQQRIERRGTRSWSVVFFRSDDGPFETINNTGITMTPSVLTGNGTLTASRNYFTAFHLNALFKLIGSGQNVSATVTAADVQTASIRVIGIEDNRDFTATVSGVFVATVTLQRSLDDATWEDLDTYTTPGSRHGNDGLDNQIVYYRLNVKPGAYTSGTLTMSLSYAGGTSTGIARVTEYTSPTVVQVQVVKPFGSMIATLDWFEGSWSPARGAPSAVALHEGRLWWAGKNRQWGSVSDSFSSYDRDIEGDSASIQRTIGFGPADTVAWLYPADDLLLGLASNEIALRSTSFRESLTPANAVLRKSTNRGAAPLDVVEADNRVYFVQRSRRKIFELNYEGDTDKYPAVDINALTPRLHSSNIVRLAMTREPETRMYVVLADGTMRVWLSDTTEDVKGWCRVTLQIGSFRDVVVLPGAIEDVVYATVELNGDRWLTRLAMFQDAVGGSMSRHLDLGKFYTSPGVTLTGLDMLVGEFVDVWADGRDRGTFLVQVGGTVTLPANAWVNVTAGMSHTARWQSNKLTDYMTGWVLGQVKRVDHLGFVFENVVPGGITYGSDESHLSPMPFIEAGQEIDPEVTVAYYDKQGVEFNGTFDSDSRVYLQATAPVTVLALVFTVDDPNG